MELSLSEIQEKVEEHIRTFKEGYWEPLALLAAIIEELGEVSRELMSIHSIKPKKEEIKNLEEELGDLFYSVICLANYYKINLQNAVLKSISKYMERDKNRWKPKNT